MTHYLRMPVGFGPTGNPRFSPVSHIEYAPATNHKRLTDEPHTANDQHASSSLIIYGCPCALGPQLTLAFLPCLILNTTPPPTTSVLLPMCASRPPLRLSESCYRPSSNLQKSQSLPLN